MPEDKDLDTIKEDLEREKAVRFKNSSEWQWAKEKLEKFMVDYLSLASVPEYKTATSLMNEIQTRKKAVGIIKTWIEEIEGDSEAQQINKDKIINNGNELISHFGEEKYE